MMDDKESKLITNEDLTPCLPSYDGTLNFRCQEQQLLQSESGIDIGGLCVPCKRHVEDIQWHEFIVHGDPIRSWRRRKQNQEESEFGNSTSTSGKRDVSFSLLNPTTLAAPQIQPAQAQASTSLPMAVAGPSRAAKQSLNVGFCVLSELVYQNIYVHAYNSYHRLSSSRGKYGFIFFEGTFLCAPVGTRQSELSKCGLCEGVFYKHRASNHECTHPDDSMDQGKGLYYCLMCQHRCDDIKNHWLVAHENNGIYELCEISGVLTLIPSEYKSCGKNFDSFGTINSYCENSPQSFCDSCGVVVFKNRRRRKCEAKKCVSAKI